MPLERRSGLPEEEDEGWSPLDIPGAIFGDIKEFGVGLGTLVGALGTDIFYGATEVFGGGPPKDRGYVLDDIFKAIPGAIAQDYKQRYGSGKGFVKGLQEDPLFFLADVFAAAGIAGKGARAAGVSAQTAKTPLAKILAPGPKVRIVGSELVEKAGLQNPLLRLIADKAETRFGTTPLSAIEQDIGKLRAIADSEDMRSLLPGEKHRLAEMETVLQKAKEGGLTNVTSPWLSEHLLRRKAWQLDGRRRSAVTQAMIRARQDFPKQRLADLTDDDMATAQRVLDGDDLAAADLQRLGRIKDGKLGLRTQIDLPIYGQAKGMSAEAAVQALRDVGPMMDQPNLDRLIVDALMDDTGRNGLQELVIGGKGQSAELDNVIDRVSTFIGRNKAEIETGADRVKNYVTAIAPLYRTMRQVEDADLPVGAAVTEGAMGRTINVRRAQDETSDIIRQHDDARRLVRAHFSEMVNPDLNNLDSFLKEYRLAVFNHLTNPFLEKGQFSPSKILGRTYMRQRKNRIRQARPGENDFDAKLGDFRDVPESNPLVIDDEYFNAGRPTPIYRHEQAAALEDLGVELVSAHGKRLLRERGTSGGGMYRRGDKLGVGKPMGHRQTKGQLAPDMRDLNIENAYQHAVAAQTKYFELRDMLEKVAAFARPISDMETVSKAEKLIDISALDRMMRVDGAAESRLADLVGDGIEVDEALHQTFREVLGQVGEESAEQFAQWKKSAAAGQLYAVPRKVADDIDALLKPHFGPSVRVFFDTPTAVWRNTVLSLSPRWIVNNFLGNIIFLKLQGGRLTDVLRQFQPEFRKQLREAVGEEGRAIIGPGFAESMDVPVPKGGARIEQMAGKIRQKTGPVGRAFKKASDFGRHVNSAMEDAFRYAGAMTAAEKSAIRKGVLRTTTRFWQSKQRLERLAEAGGDPKLLDEFADDVNRFFNDYQLQSPNGRNYTRRFVYPFWGFYRHMAKLTLQLPFEHAPTFVAWRQLTEIGNDIREEYGPLPNYAEGAYQIGPGTTPGSFDFLSTRGANPFEGVSDPMNKALVSAHPLLRVIAEQATGRSTFTGRKFSGEDIVTPFGSEQQFQIIKDDEGNVVDAKPVNKVTPGILEHFLQMIPQYQMAKETYAGGRVADTTTMLGVLRGEGVQRRADTGEIVSPKSLLEQLARISGFSTFNVNVKKFQERLTEDEKRAIDYFIKLQAAEEKAEEGP